ncbi:hypothetical protein K1T71_000279 [Dendrolimus kikuchii]|uniref:Uncharacterized protein n=1 Tax=Dendrolimus kikuchii TaxID=765133 RepID=A0ACC1DKE5_9NEOP|nr:hypothetical protein K1T71_000279 [Dendrolimus kikuchii]
METKKVFFGVLPLLICGNCAEADAITGVQRKRQAETPANNTDIGKQEAITFYNNEGSKLDLTKIGNPLVTNVSAQDLVGISDGGNKKIDFDATHLDWMSLNDINSLQLAPMGVNNSDFDTSNVKRRSVPSLIINGNAKIPEEVGIKSIEIPPLIVLSNKYSKIPIPIPNTSLVSYAKVNMSVVGTP